METTSWDGGGGGDGEHRPELRDTEPVNLLQMSLLLPPPDTEFTVCELNCEIVNMPPKSDPRFHEISRHLKDIVLFDPFVVPDLRAQQEERERKQTFRKAVTVKQESSLVQWLFSDADGGKTGRLRSVLQTGLSLFGLTTPTRRPQSLCVTDATPLMCMAFHRYRMILSVALRDNTIRHYSLTTQSYLPLIMSHDFHQDIACMEWQPNASCTLAVACRYGICIWTCLVSDPTHDHVSPVGDVDSVSSPIEHAWMSYLRHPGHEPVTSLSWSPDGSLLASGSEFDSAVLLWDVTLGVCSPLRRIAGGGISMLSWSPTGLYLFASGTNGVFRVWESDNWTCQRWSKFKGHIQSACWSPDGVTLVYNVAGTSRIHVARFPDEPELWKRSLTWAPTKASGSYATSYDVSRFYVSPDGHTSDGNGDDDGDDGGDGDGGDDDDVFTVGGVIRRMSWDPTGERLAVSFTSSRVLHPKAVKPVSGEWPPPAVDGTPSRDNGHREWTSGGAGGEGGNGGDGDDGDVDDDDGSDLIALFSTSAQGHTMQFYPLGYMRGTVHKMPDLLTWKHNFDGGALLAAAWEDGSVWLYPLYF